MLKWYEENGERLGFDDDTFLYRVAKGDWEDLEPLDLEDLEDAYWDEVAHERMEIAKGLSW